MKAATENSSFSSEIKRLETLVKKVLSSESVYQKIDHLEKECNPRAFALQVPYLKEFLEHDDPYEEYVLLSLIALGQGPTIFLPTENAKEKLTRLIAQLLDIEKFYDSIGGVIGYHLKVLQKFTQEQVEPMKLSKPEGLDISEDSSEAFLAVRAGIENIPSFAEIYPIGGAGDRLMLKDEKTEKPLPAACLPFLGRSLLECLIRDLQAREYLYYKLFGKQPMTPIAFMTSHEKDNDSIVRSICREKRFFGRSEKSFFYFVQPLVPMISKFGIWCCSAPLKFVLKPGGHGAIWKLALDSGALEWFEDHDRTHALVRQINNPLAGVDCGLLALSGEGFRKKKSFGFASCERRVGTAEGMNVLVEKQGTKCITNVEYPEFSARGIQDQPAKPGSPYSAFPANTNILFTEIKRLREAIEKDPVPGMIVNLKTKASCLDEKGHVYQEKACRLESTMQNIADVMVDSSRSTDLQTFLTYNKRSKTISVTKKSYTPGKEVAETPEGAFYERLLTFGELFREECLFSLPDIGTPEGPQYLIDFHPALGPAYSVISQKIRGGSLKSGSELELEIAEVDLSSLYLDGSLLIHSDASLGEKDELEVIRYSELCGRVELKNVRVVNRGIDRTKPNQYWKKQIERLESLRIFLKGNAEFSAENVTLTGDQEFVVPDGHRMVVSDREGQLHIQLEEITAPTWRWDYSFEQNQIKIQKNRSS